MINQVFFVWIYMDLGLFGTFGTLLCHLQVERKPSPVDASAETGLHPVRLRLAAQKISPVGGKKTRVVKDRSFGIWEPHIWSEYV